MCEAVELPLKEREWIDGPEACAILKINKDTFNNKIRVDPKFVKMGVEDHLVRGRFSQYLLRKYARREYK